MGKVWDISKLQQTIGYRIWTLWHMAIEMDFFGKIYGLSRLDS